MAINKKLIHFLKKENFENEVANGNILDNSIVFIKDTKEIWTHGTYYGSDVEILDNKVDKIEGKGLSTNDFTDSYKSQLDDAPFVKGVGADSAVSNSNYGCEATGANSFANGIYAKATGVASTALGRYCLASGRGAFAGGGLVYTLYLTGSGTKYTLSTSTTANSAPLYWLLHPDKTLVGNEFITAVTNGTNLHVANITEAVVENDIITVTVDKVISTSNISNAKYYLLGCLATGTSSHAEGLSFKASGTSAHVEGSHTIATGFAAHAEGNQTFANENSAHSEGYGTIALGMISHAEGSRTQALEEASHAEGNQTKASGPASHTEGLKTSASNIASHAEGNYTIASGQVSHAEGSRTQALGNKSHAEGSGTNAIGHASHAEGSYTNAVGDMSHVEGGSLFNIYFSGDGSNNTYQIKNGSNWQYVEDLEKLVNAEILETDNFEVVATIKSYVLGDDGYTITVTLDNSLGVLDPYVLYGVRLGIAEGEFSHSQNAATKSVGEASTSMGLFTVAQADSSLSTGCRTVARGENSATFGEHTFTTNNGEFALGISNISHTGETEESQTLLSVGIGSESPELDMVTRIKNQIPFTSMQDGKNALEIMRNGDIWFGEYNNGIKAYDNATKTTPFIEKSSEDSDKVILGDGTLKSLSEIGGGGSGDSSYILPAAGTELGGVKSGGDVTISEGIISISEATTETKGLMSAADKVKLDEFKYSSDYAFDLSKDIYIKNLAPIISLCDSENSNNIIELHVEGEDYSGIYISNDGGFTNSTISNQACTVRQVDYTSKTVTASVGYNSDLSDEDLTIGCISGTAHINLFGAILDDEGGSSNGYCGLHASGSENTTLSINIDNEGADLGLYNHLTDEEVLIVACEPDSYHSDKGTTYILSPKFIKTGGTANEILMADGSVKEVSNLLTDTKVISLNNEDEDEFANVTLDVEDAMNPSLVVSRESIDSSSYSTKMYMGFNESVSDEELSMGIVVNDGDECRAAGILAEVFTGFKAYTESRKALISVNDDGDSYISLQSTKDEDLVTEKVQNTHGEYYYHEVDPKGIYIRCRIPEEDGLAEKYGESHIKCPRFVTTGGTADQVVLGDGTLKNLNDFNTFDPSILASKQDKIEDILTLSADGNTSNNIINVKTTVDDASASNIEILYNYLLDGSARQQQMNIYSAGINSSYLENYEDSQAKVNISKNFGIFTQDAANNMKLSLNYEDEIEIIAYDIKQSHYNNAEILVSTDSCYTHFVGNLNDGLPSEATLGITSGQVSILELKRYSLHIKACVNAGNPYIEIYSRADGTTTITPTDITSPKFIKTNGTANEILMADGSVKEVSEVGKSYSTATESEDGLMSKTTAEAFSTEAITYIYDVNANVTPNNEGVNVHWNVWADSMNYLTGELNSENELGFVDFTIPLATTTSAGLMSKGMYSALKDGFIANIVEVTINGNSVELSYDAAYPNGDGTFNMMEGEGVEIPLATTTSAGVMSKEDKIKLDSLSTSTDGGMTISGTVNLTNGTFNTQNNSSLNSYTKVFNNMSVGEMRMYLVADSSGNLPSTSETAVTVPYDGILSPAQVYFGKSQAFGVSVGDICVLFKKSSLLNICRIIPLNDVKPANGDFPGADGLATVWDKNRINKIDGIEWMVNNVNNNYLPRNDRFPSRADWLINVDYCIDNGVYPTCDTASMNVGWTNQYVTLIVQRTSTADNGGYNTVEQTAYGRGSDEGRIYKRIIFVKSDDSDVQYGQWINIVSRNNAYYHTCKYGSDSMLNFIRSIKYSLINMSNILDGTIHFNSVDDYVGVVSFFKYGDQKCKVIGQTIGSLSHNSIYETGTLLVAYSGFCGTLDLQDDNINYNDCLCATTNEDTWKFNGRVN